MCANYEVQDRLMAREVMRQTRKQRRELAGTLVALASLAVLAWVALERVVTAAGG